MAVNAAAGAGVAASVGAVVAVAAGAVVAVASGTVAVGAGVAVGCGAVVAVGSGTGVAVGAALQADRTKVAVNMKLRVSHMLFFILSLLLRVSKTRVLPVRLAEIHVPMNSPTFPSSGCNHLLQVRSMH